MRQSVVGAGFRLDAVKELPSSTEVLIAGAGVAGSALAFELGKRGVQVVLLDRSPTGPQGASTVPAALINPHRGRTARATAADLSGAEAFWRMTREVQATVGASGAYQTGVLRVADNARQARNWQRLVDTQWLQPGEVNDPYHAPFGALVVPSGGWIDTRLLLESLAAGAKHHSASVHWGVELVGVGNHNGYSDVARTTSQLAVPPVLSGRRPQLGAQVNAMSGRTPMTINCCHVVLATGAWQPEKLPLPKLELIWGEALVLDLGITPPLPLAGAVVAAFQHGKAMVSGGHRHVGWLGRGAASSREPPTPQQADDHLRRALAWHLPAAADATEISHWQGVRAKRASGEPVVRQLRPGVHLMSAFGGRGFLRAALAAEQLAAHLASKLR